MDAFETFEHAGLTCELHQDIEPTSPADWDTLGTLAGFYDVRRNWRGFEDDDFRAEEAYDRLDTRGMLRYLRLQGIIAIPVRFEDYGSSGATLHESDDPNAYLYATPASIEMTGVSPERVEEGLRAELREWDAYYRGEVVGYVVRDSSGEVVESCWGFYPDSDGDGLDYVRGEARDAAEWEAQERTRAANQDIATR